MLMENDPEFHLDPVWGTVIIHAASDFFRFDVLLANA